MRQYDYIHNKRNQRSCKMKKIKQTVPYNLKKVLAGIMLVAVPVFVSCEKDPVKPDQPSQPQKHNKVLVFDGSGQQIHPDTIRYYLNQPNIDSVLMQAADPEMCCHLAPEYADNVVQFLQSRCDISPRVAGTNDLFFATNAYQSTVNQARTQGFNARYIGTKQKQH